MKLAVCQLKSGRALITSHRLADPMASWVQFGDQLLTLAPEDRWTEFQRRADEAGMALREIPHRAEMGELFLVRQKGRLFQRDHPGVPVLFDRGRYLVVRIVDEPTRRSVQRTEPCYKVIPLQPNMVVFEDRPAPEFRVAADPWVEQFVNRIEDEAFVSTLTDLTHYRTRHSVSTHYRSAADWCVSLLTSLNYETQLQEISVTGAPSYNVIARKAGSAEQGTRKLVLVTAHLDSINWAAQGAPDAIAPGADDNGSGSAGLLEMARALHEHTFTHDLHFVLFGGEEEGLFGSQAYVAALAPADRSRTKAVVNMDMIGGLNTESPSVTIESSSNFAEMVQDLTTAGHTYASLKIEVSWHYFDSDHVPFIEAGIPSALTIEGADTTNHFIHGPDDTIGHVNAGLASEILRMNTAFVAMAAR